MYHVSDTIAAVSSPSSDRRVLIRISGPETIEAVNRFFKPRLSASSGIMSGKLKVDDELAIDAELYLFKTPHSYTGQDLAEIHINSNASVTEALLRSLLEDGLRMAEPG
jgi:tRNA modification GTPase